MENASCKNVSVQFWESTLRDSLKGLRSRYLSLLLFFVWTKKEGHFFSLFSLGNQRKWQICFAYTFIKRRMYETRKLRKNSKKLVSLIKNKSFQRLHCISTQFSTNCWKLCWIINSIKSSICIFKVNLIPHISKNRKLTAC